MMKLFGSGRDESILADSTRTALFGTCGLWIAFIVLVVLLPSRPKAPEYKTVQITLNAPVVQPVVKAEPVVTPAPEKPAVVEKKSPEQPAPKKQPAAEKPAQPKQAQKKPAAKKSAGTSSERPVVKHEEPVTYAKSVDDLLAQQTAPSQKSAQWDDSLFTDSAVESTAAPSPKAPAKKISGAQALSGTAAQAASEDSGPVVSTSSQKKTAAGGSASSATKSALGRISAATYTQSDGSGTSSRVSANTASSGGKVSLEMSDGSARALIDPAKPVITISKENANLIDTSRTVTIQFKVLAGGNVPLSEIDIRPSSALPLSLQSEIRAQIASWRFAPGESDGIARFEYSIIKK